jgi:hypothetical protein
VTMRGITLLFLATILMFGASSFAQTTDTIQTVHVAGAAPAPGPGIAMSFRTETMDAATVKGVPFCATVTNSHLQTFADGNRISTSDSSMVCRDGEGRMRREAQLDLLGAVPDGGAPKIITITDPVAGVRYMLDTQAKIARKTPLNPKVIAEASAMRSGPNVVYKSAGPMGPDPTMGGGRVMIMRDVQTNGGPEADGAQPQSEAMGDQTIGGVRASGTRITTTIPAGKMGNEQPINIVSERWYSADLKATVMTKHTDPWAGQLTTQFSNVSTAEPDPSLFTVPANYTIVDEKDGPMIIKLPPPQQ